MNGSLGSFYRRELLANGPATVEELHAAAVAAGVTTSRTDSGVRSVLARDPCFIRRPDGRFDCAKRLLAGNALTTRVRYPTADRMEVWTGPELAPMDLLFVDGPVPLTTGGTVTRSPAWQGTWIGPPGWLPKAMARELLAFRWTGAALDVSTLADPPDACAVPPAWQVQRVREVLSRHRPPGGYPPARLLERAAEDLARTVLRALVEVPDLFTEEVPPLDELLGSPLDVPAEAVPDGWGAGRRDDADAGVTALHLELPRALADELLQHAPMGMSLREYAEQVLAVEGWRRQGRASERHR